MDINACETPHVPLVVSLAPHRLIPSVGQAELANVGAVHVESGSGRVRAVAHEVQVADLPAFTLLSWRFTNCSSGRARLHAAHVAMGRLD